MVYHSKKEKGTNEFEESEKQKLVMDSQFDTCALTHSRRSKRMRFKTLTLADHLSPYVVPNLANGSLSVSEILQEQEELARCLMLLFKDSSKKGHFALVTEPSDNNLVVLEPNHPLSVQRLLLQMVAILSQMLISLWGRFGRSYPRTSDERDENCSDIDTCSAPMSHNSKALNGMKSSKAEKKLKSKKGMDKSTWERNMNQVSVM
ncbi:hypothetical protein SESBI_08852 [Sesbania bispinosa]|nr:hypothetical protein SESBI_08852 [Sesbania bispinosa]